MAAFFCVVPLLLYATSARIHTPTVVMAAKNAAMTRACPIATYTWVALPVLRKRHSTLMAVALLGCNPSQRDLNG